MVEIFEAIGAEALERARGLMREYGAHLAANPSGAANICLVGYEAELAELRGAYEVILVATVEGQAAGCVALKPIATGTEEGACEMKRLWVGNGFRGLGLGRRLVEDAIRWAEQHGYGAMYLDTVPAAMPEANALYERIGFVRVGRYNDNSVADVVFFRRGLGTM